MFKFTPLNGKKPILTEWLNQASNDPTTLTQWAQSTQDFGIVTGQGFIVVDVDVKDHNGFANLAARGIELPHTLTQTTASGGAHYFYKTDKRFNNTTSKIVKGVDTRGVGGQVKIYDWSIINRYDEMTPLPGHIESLITAEPETTKKSNIPVLFSNPEKQLDIILDELMDTPEGERNARLFVKASEAKSKVVNNGQLQEDYVKDRLINIAAQLGLGQSETKATLKSAFRTTEVYSLPFTPSIVTDMTGVGIKERWLPKKPTVKDLMNKSKLRKPVIFKDWSSRDITLINADGGTGKTTFLLFETIHAALGLPLWGFIPSGKFKTLFVTGEDDAEKLYALIGSICTSLNLNESQIDEVLERVRIKKDIDLTLITKTRDGFLIPNYAALNEMTKELEDFRPDKIIFDPIASFWGSEAALNDMSKAVAKWCGMLRDSLNCEVVLVNHIGKASSQSKDVTQFAGRGGSALPSHARINKVMRRVDANEYTEMTSKTLPEGSQAIMLVCTKYTDYSPILDKTLLFVRHDFNIERVEINKNSIDVKADSRSDDEIIYEFIQHNEISGIECSKKYIESMLAGRISRAKIADALTRLTIIGLNGNKLFLVDSIDLTKTDKVYKTEGE